MSKKKSKGKKILFSLLGIFFTLLFILAAGELVARLFFPPAPEPVPNPPYDYRLIDKEFGWLTKTNYTFDGEMTDRGSGKYPVHLTTNEHGFRLFGDPNVSNRPKLFFIGDSYTHAVEVSDDKTFYSLLRDTLNAECFAYGSAGYGTLQQYMILDRYIDTIKPNVVIVQVCSNDFIDNYHKLELVGDYKVGKPRPYLNLRDKIVYRHPVPFVEKVKPYSWFLYFLLTRIYDVQETVFGKKEEKPPELGEKLIAEMGTDYPLFAHSIKLTKLSMQRIKNRLPTGTKLLVFNADHYQPQANEFEKICRELDIQYTGDPARQVLSREESGEVMRSADGYHWDESGHKVVADILYGELYPMVGSVVD